MNREEMTCRDLDYYHETHSKYYRAILPCGYKIDRLNNDTVCEMLNLLVDIQHEISIIKRQISAHDHHIENKLRRYKKHEKTQ